MAKKRDVERRMMVLRLQKLWEYNFVLKDRSLSTVLKFNLEGNNQRNVANTILSLTVKDPDQWRLQSITPLRRWEEYAEWIGKIRMWEFSADG